MFSLSATAFPEFGIGTRPSGDDARPGCDVFAIVFLRSMMGKSHSDDKRCPQGGLLLGHEAGHSMINSA
jgi:hypothetical protein